MLRLNPSTLSIAFEQQLLEGAAHLKPRFETTLLALISRRLLDPTLQRSNSGSIALGNTLTYFWQARNAPQS